MQINIIKALAENIDIQTLESNIENLENEQELTIDVIGKDEGEQLTHLLGALWIKEQVEKNSSDVKTELRNFSAKVRTSIS